MGNRNLNLGTINDAIGTFAMEARLSDGLFGIGKEYYVVFKEDSQETNGYLLATSIESNGATATAIMLEDLLNKRFLEINELRATVVSALKKAAPVAKSNLTQCIVVLAA